MAADIPTETYLRLMVPIDIYIAMVNLQISMRHRIMADPTGSFPYPKWTPT